MWRIATIGATLSGNKGAASMLQSALDNLPPLLGDVHFSVLSIYPGADARLNEENRVEIVPARPVALVVAVPLAAAWKALLWLRLPAGPLRRSPLLATLDRSDVLIDLSGISFSDGRLVELIYNVACVLPALLIGKPVVKYSQAMGPFQTWLNRSVARALLPHMELNIARGRRTLSHLKQLGLENVALCADAAFSMAEQETQAARDALSSLDHFGEQKIVGISVSSVVWGYCHRCGIDYPQVLAEFADRVIKRGYGVWLIAHSVRESEKASRTNDVGACNAVYELVQERHSCQLVVEDYSPSVLRTIIGKCHFLVACRFHAMVSALATGVPTIVTSWSHKYTEVLEMFDLEEWAIGHQTLSTDALWERFQKLVETETEVKERIARHLPAVVASSKQNAALVASLLSRQRG